MKISRTLYILFAGWMVLLTIASLVPLKGVDLGGNRDKIVHFIAYFFNAVLFYVSFRTRFKKADIYAVLFAFFYGAILELGQSFVPGRDCSLLDATANFSGALFFFLLYRILWGKA
jgi:VanZ family protein